MKIKKKVGIILTFTLLAEMSCNQTVRFADLPPKVQQEVVEAMNWVNPGRGFDRVKTCESKIAFRLYDTGEISSTTVRSIVNEKVGEIMEIIKHTKEIFSDLSPKTTEKLNKLQETTEELWKVGDLYLGMIP